MSTAMLDHIIDANHMDSLTSHDVKTVQAGVGGRAPRRMADARCASAACWGCVFFAFASAVNTCCSVCQPQHVPRPQPCRRCRAPQSMILSGHGASMAPPPGKRWLYEIVANGRNNIDVDKVRYRRTTARHGCTAGAV